MLGRLLWADQFSVLSWVQDSLAVTLVVLWAKVQFGPLGGLGRGGSSAPANFGP